MGNSLQPSPAVTVVDVQIEPSPSGDLIFVSTRLQLNDSTRILSAISEDGGLRAVRSTIPWAVVLPRASSANLQETYAPPLTPQTFSTVSWSTQHNYSHYVRHYFQKTSPLRWDFELHMTHSRQRRLYLTQKDPFMFYANGKPVPTFVFTLHLETQRQTRKITVKVDPNEVLQQKAMREERKNFLLAHPFTRLRNMWPWFDVSGSTTAPINLFDAFPLRSHEIFSAFPVSPMVTTVTASYAQFMPHQQLSAMYKSRFSVNVDIPILAENVPCPTLAGDCGGSPPPQPPPAPVLEVVSAMVSHTTYQKGEPIMLQLTLRNTGNQPAYYLYSRFLIENVIGYSDYTVWTSSFFVTSYLGVGRSITVQYSVGPLLTNHYALNIGTFLLAKVKVWAKNALTLEQSVTQLFTIEKGATHKVFAVVYYDRAFNKKYGFWADRPERTFVDALTIWPLHYRPNGQDWQETTFKDLFNTEIIVLRKFYRDSFSETNPSALLDNLPVLAQRDLGLSRKWDENEPSLGTSRYNHGFDILIGFSGKLSSTTEGGVNLGNIFAVFGGITIANFVPYPYGQKEFCVAIIHEFQHSYGVLKGNRWSADHNIDTTKGHIKKYGNLMSAEWGDSYYYYSEYYDVSPTIVDMQRKLYIYDGP